jgi:glycopeptide antibiotics resistance protein
MSKGKRPILIIVFALYCMALAYLTLLKGIGATFDMSYAEYLKASSNFIPFFSFYVFLTTPYKSAVVVKYFITGLIGNLLLFLPWGLLLPSIVEKLRSFKRFFIFTTLVIIAIEFLQLFLMLGSYDIEDYLLNIIGAVTGFFLYRKLDFLH